MQVRYFIILDIVDGFQSVNLEEMVIILPRLCHIAER